MKSLIFPWRTDIHHQQVRLAFKEAIGQLFRLKVVSASLHLGEETLLHGGAAACRQWRSWQESEPHGQNYQPGTDRSEQLAIPFLGRFTPVSL